MLDTHLWGTERLEMGAKHARPPRNTVTERIIRKLGFISSIYVHDVQGRTLLMAANLPYASRALMD